MDGYEGWGPPAASDEQTGAQMGGPYDPASYENFTDGGEGTSPEVLAAAAELNISLVSRARRPHHWPQQPGQTVRGTASAQLPC
jgi:hypothetical protein